MVLLLCVLLLLLRVAATSCLTCVLAATSSSVILGLTTHLLIVRLMLSEDLLTHFLLPLVDIRIKLVTIFSDRELLVVVDRDVDAPIANGLILRIVELSYVGVFQSLVCS